MSQYRKVSEHSRFRLLSGLFLFSMHKIPNIFKGKELLIRFCTKRRTHLTSSQHLRISGFAARHAVSLGLSAQIPQKTLKPASR